MNPRKTRSKTPKKTSSKSPSKSSSKTFKKPPKIKARNVNVFYGKKQALFDISIDIEEKETLALIGPSGCGKSTFLRCLNRINDNISSCSVEGEITIDGKNIYDQKVDVATLRRRVGMVFQKPNPFPKSVFDNVAYGPRLHGLHESKSHLEQIVEQSLEKAGLWSEVKDRLHEGGTALSGGQQQRLCIARAIAINPDVILMDEPCSALDPVATARVEALIDELRKSYTIVIVTHSMQQAGRVAKRTAFFYLGELVEFGKTAKILTAPKNKRTQDYITGRFG